METYTAHPHTGGYGVISNDTERTAAYDIALRQCSASGAHHFLEVGMGGHAFLTCLLLRILPKATVVAVEGNAAAAAAGAAVLANTAGVGTRAVVIPTVSMAVPAADMLQLGDLTHVLHEVLGWLANREGAAFTLRDVGHKLAERPAPHVLPYAYGSMLAPARVSRGHYTRAEHVVDQYNLILASRMPFDAAGMLPFLRKRHCLEWSSGMGCGGKLQLRASRFIATTELRLNSIIGSVFGVFTVPGSGALGGSGSGGATTRSSARPGIEMPDCGCAEVLACGVDAVRAFTSELGDGGDVGTPANWQNPVWMLPEEWELAVGDAFVINSLADLRGELPTYTLRVCVERAGVVPPERAVTFVVRP